MERFEVLSDASDGQSSFVDAVRDTLPESSIGNAYLFRANIGEVSAALAFGFVPGWKGAGAAVKIVDGTWKRLNPQGLLAIVPLSPELEEQVSSVCKVLY